MHLQIWWGILILPFMHFSSSTHQVRLLYIYIIHIVRTRVVQCRRPGTLVIRYQISTTVRARDGRSWRYTPISFGFSTRRQIVSFAKWTHPSVRSARSGMVAEQWWVRFTVAKGTWNGIRAERHLKICLVDSMYVSGGIWPAQLRAKWSSSACLCGLW